MTALLAKRLSFPVVRCSLIILAAFALGGCSRAQPLVSGTAHASPPALVQKSVATSATAMIRAGVDDTPEHLVMAYYKALSKGAASEANSYLSRENPEKGKVDYFASDYCGCSITNIVASDRPLVITGRPDFYRRVIDLRQVGFDVRFKHHSPAGETGEVFFVANVARDAPGGPWRIVEIGTA